jgi:hypothetical protein
MIKRNRTFDSPEGGDELLNEPPLGESTGQTSPEQPPPPPSVDESVDVKGRPVDQETPPLTAPKANESTGVASTTSPEIRHPELESPVAPADVFEAPPSLDQEQREPWGDRPTYEQLLTAEVVQVRTVDERSVGIYVAGIKVLSRPTDVLVQSVRDRSDSHLRALASEPAIEVKLVK